MTTIRQTIVDILRQGPVSARDLALMLLLKPREVEEHLAHIQKSLGKKLKIEPAACGRCGFVFSARSRLDAPGRCPRCRDQKVEGPWFRVEE